MRKYEGDWIDCFNVKKYVDKNHPDRSDKILFETPCIDYIITKEQFHKLKQKINEV
ncbi:hypothetical protein [Methanobrevibacter sp.]|uniref:hypothetical protein n=1 Tax=Methanobrevibacter sp. TaxID=66852 RepID=UPI003D7EDAF7